MSGPTNRRRSKRLITTTLLALVAQGLLVGASPLADVHYHRFGPVQVEPLGSHKVSQRPGICPECLAMQTLAVPGTPVQSLRWEWTREEAPTPTPAVSYAPVRLTSRFARAPPASPGATLQTL